VAAHRVAAPASTEAPPLLRPARRVWGLVAVSPGPSARG